MRFLNSEAHSRLAVERERLHLLGLACSLALARLVLVLRKYNPNQPRDSHGRWTTDGDSNEDSDVYATGSIILRNDRTGDSKIDKITDRLNGILSKEMDELGPGFGPEYGSDLHYNFADSVRQEQLPGIMVEDSWGNGVPLPYGSPGSVRTDVIYRDVTEEGLSVRAIWDVKSGSASLSKSRVDDLRVHTGASPDTPVIELHAIRGIISREIDFDFENRADARRLHGPCTLSPGMGRTASCH